jgi:hypothetical protein
MPSIETIRNDCALVAGTGKYCACLEKLMRRSEAESESVIYSHRAAYDGSVAVLQGRPTPRFDDGHCQ